MLHYLITVATLSVVVQCQTFQCPHDGKFRNPLNRVSYIQCFNGQPSVVDCPMDSYGSRQWRLVFNGQHCAEPQECPEIDGTYRKTTNGWAFFMCMNGEPAQYTCPSGTKFDGRGCVSELEDPYIHGSFQCPEDDGLYKNPHSRTSFVQCYDRKPYVKLCRQFTDNGQSWSLVFDGERCVQPFECPEIDNTFKRVNSGRVHYKCKDGEIEEYHCAKGTTFDGRGCRPPPREQINQRPAHFRILVQNRHMIKFEFENKVVTDTFDQVSWRWNRLVEYNDFI